MTTRRYYMQVESFWAWVARDIACDDYGTHYALMFARSVHNNVVWC